jgi:hypothetical protein
MADLTPLIAACQRYGSDLNGLVTHNNKRVHGARLLWAIAGNESNFGLLREYVREEKGYMPGGYYYRLARHVRSEHKRWGVLASSSYGSFQLMYIVAYEMGYREHPILLQNDEVCARWASEFIAKRIIGAQKAKTLEAVLDAYNTGNPSDANIPTTYVQKGIKYYEQGIPTASQPAAVMAARSTETDQTLG